MAPIQKISNRPPLRQAHIFPAASNEQQHTSSPSSPILPRTAPPTTHDPTIKPPWKKHKSHPTPPTPGWAMLWPRPPSWRCPPDASSLSGYAGCEYVEAPKVFDPEIEGLPDWMAPGEKEQRLWSGIERVVVVPGVDGGKKVGRRGVEGGEEEGEEEGWEEGQDGEEDEEWKGRGVRRAVFQLPRPLARHSTSTSASVLASTSAASPTLISAPAPTSTLATPRTSISIEEIYTIIEGNMVRNTFTGLGVPVIIALASITALGFYCGWKLIKDRKRKGKSRKEARRRDEQTEASEPTNRRHEMALETARDRVGAQSMMPDETWEDLSLR